MDRTSWVIGLTTGAVLTGMVVAWWPDVTFALALENSPLAWLQSSLLVAAASVAGVRALVAAAQGAAAPEGRPWRWGVIALLLLGAALDERFMGHERIQEWVFYDLLNGQPAFHQVPQTLTALYGLVGLWVLGWMRRVMDPSAWRACRAAVVLGLLAILLDLTFDTVRIQLFEELLETAAETAFLCGLFREVGSSVCRRC